MKGHVKDRLRTYGLFDRLGDDHFHPTVGSVVRAYLGRYPDVEWHDWEDEPVPTPVPSGPRPEASRTQPTLEGGPRGGGPLRPPG
jgi:hypothetical protein